MNSRSSIARLRLSAITLAKSAGGAAAALVIQAAIAPASAQVQSAVPPIWSSIDKLGVNATTGQFHLSTPEVSIGQDSSGGLVHGRQWIANGWRDTLAGTIDSIVFMGITVYQVNVSGHAEQFLDQGSGIQPNAFTGSTLTFNSGTGIYTLTTGDGAVALFDRNLSDSSSTVTNFWTSAAGWTSEGLVTQLTKPDGEVVTWTYTSASAGGQTARRPQSISNNLGYQIHFTYSINSPANASEVTGGYLQRTKVTGINRAYYYCADTATSCSDSTGANWPYVTYGTESGGTIETVTDRLSRVTRYVFSSGQLTNVRLPSSSTTNRLSITYSAGMVSYVDSSMAGYDGASYVYGDVGNVRTTTISPSVEGGVNVVKSDIFPGWVTEVWEDASGTRKLINTRDSYGRITRATRGDGSYVEFGYDARGNVTQTTRAPKTGSLLSSMTAHATYPATCSNPKTCNKPESKTDFRGFRTDFTYHPAHGGLATATLPAPSGPAPVGSGTQHQTRYSYTQLNAYYKDASGSIVQGGAVYRLVGTSACATGSTCTGTSDETKSVIAYGSTWVANNLLPTLATTSDGTGTLSVSKLSTYTPLGDLASIDGPLAGSADTTSFYYDDMRRLRASVGPDPDGGGPLSHRVTKFTFNIDGIRTSLQKGFVSSPASWSSLTVMEEQNFGISAAGTVDRAELASLSASPAHAVTQFAYGARSNVSCTAVRMNPSTFGALPGACNAATAGTYGPDIRTRPLRNLYFENTAKQEAYGTADQRSEFTATYSNSGELETATDAKNNKTTYTYDGFSRLEKTFYPSPSTPGTSSTTDYEQLFYGTGANSGLITSKRLRDASYIYYCYDNVGRISKYSVTASDTTCATPKVVYSYDNLGRVTEQTIPGFIAVWRSYDALSRLTSETRYDGSPNRTVSYEYDVAGRRTKMTWPGSNPLFVTYEYNIADDLTTIKERGVTALATFAYDNLGRRTTMTRANGGVTSYAYNTASWLTDLATYPANAAYNNYVTMAYNPAGQIWTRTPTNSSYTYSPPSGYSDNYTSTGLNQYTAARGITPTYTDSRGNMTYDGSKTYTYDYANRLTSASGSTPTSFSYDPLGRLYQIAGSSTFRLVYDGMNLIEETDASGNVLRRYVHGPGMDEPLVWFEGAGHSGTTTASDRRYLYRDERGSVVAVENEAGSVSINKYDPYGTPASGNTGRFQFTGQVWLAEAGLYHFKARAYSPTLGRFMQPDPIGYADGPNLYNYVGSDPGNWVDWSGMEKQEACTTPTGTHIKKCVIVDGGSRRLSSGDIKKIEESFASFIAKHGDVKGVDISGYGRPVETWINPGDDVDAMRYLESWISVMTQFAGKAGAYKEPVVIIIVSHSSYVNIYQTFTESQRSPSGAMFTYGNHAADGGGDLTFVDFDWSTWSRGWWLYDPGSAARALFHEARHGFDDLHKGYGEKEMDFKALQALDAAGLTDGGCRDVDGFGLGIAAGLPSCGVALGH